jgi:hypothetical protein
MAWFKSTHRGMFVVDYQGEFEMFSRDQGLDAWNHAADLHFREQLSPRMSLEAADSFLSTMDPTRRLANSLLLLPRGRYQENSFFTRLGYRLDHKTVLSFRFDQVFTTMDLPAELAGRLDRTGVAGTVTLDRTFNSHHALSANYAYLFIHPLDSGPGVINSGVHNTNVGYTYTVNPGLTVRLFAGVTRSLQTSFTGAAAVDKKFGNLWLSAGYQRYLAFFGGLSPVGAPIGPLQPSSAISPDSVYQVVSLRAWGRLTKRIGLEGTVQRALNGVTLENRGIKSVIAQARVDYKVNNRVTAFVRTDFYGQNISEFSAFPLSRRRYFGGLEFALSRAPELTENPNRKKPLPRDSDQDQQGETRLPGEGRLPENR